MSWKKYFTPVSTSGSLSPISGGGGAGPARSNYSSYLPDVYSGHPNRLERYGQYDTMDSDSEVNAALDILAEFCSQTNEENMTPFGVQFKDKATPTEVKIISKYLQQWTKLNKFDTRIFKLVRNTFKFGDAFFIRDPENQKWNYIDASKVVKVIVNESEGKKPEQFVIKDIAPNFMNLIATQITPNVNPRNHGGAAPGGGGGTGPQTYTGSGSGGGASSSNRFGLQQTENAINAEHTLYI